MIQDRLHFGNKIHAPPAIDSFVARPMLPSDFFNSLSH